MPQIHFLQEIPEDEARQRYARDPYNGQSKIKDLVDEVQSRVDKVLLCTVSPPGQPCSPTPYIPIRPPFTNGSFSSGLLGSDARPFSLIEAPSEPSHPHLLRVRSLPSVSTCQSQFNSCISEFGSTSRTCRNDGNASGVRFAALPVEGSSSYVAAGANGHQRRADSGDRDAPPSPSLSASGHRQFESFSSLLPQPNLAAPSQSQQQAPTGPPVHESEGLGGDELPAPPYTELSAGSEISSAHMGVHVRSGSSGNQYALEHPRQGSDLSDGGIRPTHLPASPMTVNALQGQGQRRGAPLTDQGEFCDYVGIGLNA